MKRILCWVIVVLLVTCVFTIAFRVRLVHAQAETVYINSDGSVSPSSAPISSVDNITYTFTGNMSYPTYYGVVVERNNITINGNGYTLQGNQSGDGLYLTNINNTEIENMNVEDFLYGIYLSSSSNDTVNGNTATANIDVGIYLLNPSNDTVSGNIASANSYGIFLSSSSNDYVLENNVTANKDGIFLSASSYETVSGNTATANSNGVYLSDSPYNTVSGNTATANSNGIFLSSSSNDFVYENNVSANSYGIFLSSSSNDYVYQNNVVENNSTGIDISGSIFNTIYNNDFIGNIAQATIDQTSQGEDFWEGTYPTGGNYWSDYHGRDLYSGLYQNVTGSDGIGDTPYIIDAAVDKLDNDTYPLMKPFGQSSTFVVSTPNPVSGGLLVTCTANVYGSSPTGNVTWATSSSTGSFSQSVGKLSSGNCSTTYTDNNTGYVTIMASYSGDSHNLPSNGSTTLTVFVNVSTGLNVTITPTNSLKLTFANITAAGIAVVNATPTVNAPTLNNTVGQDYSINVTAGFVGNVTVSLAFDGSNMTKQQKSNLTMVQYTPIPGDVQPPFGIVNMKDVAYIARHFGTNPTSPNWDPTADINGDGVVNMKDVALVARHFGITAGWVDITTFVDTTNNVIYGTTTQLYFIGIH